MYKLTTGDAFTVLDSMESDQFQSCITSPPYYGKRKYLPEGDPLEPWEIGGEQTPDIFISNLVATFRKVKQVLKETGTLIIVIGDSYASFRDGKCVPESGSKNQRGMPKSKARNRSAATFEGTDIKHKDLIGIPWMLAFALRKDGWYLRSDSIWAKNSFRPESVKDRPSTSHEYIFVLSKSEKYFFDKTGFPKTILTVNPRGYKGHSAAFPIQLTDPMVIATTQEDDWILDPFAGSSSVGFSALSFNRNFWGIDLNAESVKLSDERLNHVQVRLL